MQTRREPGPAVGGRLQHAAQALAVLAVIDLVAIWLWFGPHACLFAIATAIGLGFAVSDGVRAGWSKLAVGLFFGGLGFWVFAPLIRSRPLLDGFDGSNPVELVPGLLFLAGAALGYAAYVLVARFRSAE